MARGLSGEVQRETKPPGPRLVPVGAVLVSLNLWTLLYSRCPWTCPGFLPGHQHHALGLPPHAFPRES